MPRKTVPPMGPYGEFAVVYTEEGRPPRRRGIGRRWRRALATRYADMLERQSGRNPFFRLLRIRIERWDPETKQ